jgi:hypothetical protein
LRSSRGPSKEHAVHACDIEGLALTQSGPQEPVPLGRTYREAVATGQAALATPRRQTVVVQADHDDLRGRIELSGEEYGEVNRSPALQ